jgi:hypothetical protein
LSARALPASLLALLSGAAAAAPPDARLELELQRPRIERIDGGFTAVESDPPGVVRAELLPSGELLLEPQAAGEARVFLFARRLVRVLEVAVGRPLTPPAPAPSGACAKPVLTAACYPAWRERLLHLEAGQQPHLSFELEGLQAEARAADQALLRAGLLGVRFSRSPLGIRLRGAQGEEGLQAALRAVYGQVLGPLRLDR